MLINGNDLSILGSKLMLAFYWLYEDYMLPPYWLYISTNHEALIGCLCSGLVSISAKLCLIVYLLRNE